MHMHNVDDNSKKQVDKRKRKKRIHSVCVYAHPSARTLHVLKVPIAFGCDANYNALYALCACLGCILRENSVTAYVGHTYQHNPRRQRHCRALHGTRKEYLLFSHHPEQNLHGKLKLKENRFEKTRTSAYKMQPSE